MKGKMAILLAVVIILVAAGALSYYYFSYNKGSVRLSAADAPIMGGISGVFITFSDVEFHSNASGWLNYSITPVTVNILNVSINSPAYFANISLPIGKYTMIRIMIQSVTVNMFGTNYTFKMASHWGFLNHPFNVNSSSTTNIVLEFNLNSCLNMEAKVFTPYIGVIIS